jgi:hypothetical protein
MDFFELVMPFLAGLALPLLATAVADFALADVLRWHASFLLSV